MSIIGILSSNLFSGAANRLHGAQGTQGTQGTTPNFQQIREQFQQLGQDLQSGNLAQAQTDYASLSKDFPGANQAGTAVVPTTGTTPAATGSTTTTGGTSLSQEFAQLGQDLQSGNLQGAQQDYTNLQQTAQQNVAQQVGGHHRGHRHHGGEFQSALASAASSQSNPITQAFGTLAQDLQAGNLSGAQAAFATLQSDLQKIGGFASSGSGGTIPTSSTSGGATGGALNVVA
jgi:outer membrane protein assembly factor BamD (BamD/ComL family)